MSQRVWRGRVRQSAWTGLGQEVFSTLPQAVDGLARAVEERRFRLAVLHAQRRAEAQAAEQRHGEQFALGQDAVHVVDEHGHQFHVGPVPGEMVEAALEGPGVADRCPRALGKEDQRMAAAGLRARRAAVRWDCARAR